MVQGTKGNCYLCGKTLGATAMKNHILKEHAEGNDSCFLLKVEGYFKAYWLYISVPQTTTLRTLDLFLREIWCECCGHMSQFSTKEGEISPNRKLSTFKLGDEIYYEYDFGDTTNIRLTLINELSRPKQKENVQLLARNIAPEIPCEMCEKKAAVQADMDRWAFVCEDCVKDSDEDMLLPIVNSPRTGVCAYTGEEDRWTFEAGEVGKRG